MPIEVITTIEDRSGDKATTSVWVLDASTLANLNTFAPAWATAINNIIYGKILSIVARIIPTIVGLSNNTLLETADVEHKGKFVFRTNVTQTKVEVNIPCLDEAAVSAYGSDELDQTNPEVAAFIAAMETGIAVTGGTISPCDVGEISISEIYYAREAFANSGRRR